MARPSNRMAIIEAAVRAASSLSLSMITMDSVAAEAGVSKAGVIYHFATKRELVRGVQEYLARELEGRLVEAAGGSPEDLSPRDRAIAYMSVAAESATRAELVLLLEAGSDPEVSSSLTDMMNRWLPPLSVGLDDPSMLPLVLLRLAADGLWIDGLLDELDSAGRRQIAQAVSTFVFASADVRSSDGAR